MKKVLNITAIIAGLVSLVFGLIGLISIIITFAKYGFISNLLWNVLIIIIQMALGAGIIFAVKKDNAIIFLATATLALVFIILDLFVAKTAGMTVLSGAFFAGLFEKLAFIKVFNVIGYILIAVYAVIIALKLFFTLAKK